MIDKRSAKIGLIIIGVLLVSAIIYAVMRKKKIDGELEELYKAIDSDVGLLGEDIDSVLLNIKEDPNYKASKGELEKLKNAKTSFYTPDRPQDVEAVLKGKTKAQLKGLFRQFAVQYAIKFNDHLNSMFSDYGGTTYDTAGYQRILTIIKNAK